MNRAIPATGAALLVGAGLFALWRRKSAPSATAAPALVPDFAGPLGGELQRAKDNGWDLLFAASEQAHGLPPGILSAIASRETNTKNIVGDEGHGRGLMQIDDRSHGAWLKAHGAGDAGAPDVDAAIDYAAGLVQAGIAYARAHAVAEPDVLKFALSAYNAGAVNAMKGYSGGDSDAWTTGKNYGRDVLDRWHKMYPGQGDPVLAPPPEAPAPQIAGGYAPRIGAETGLAPAAQALLDQINAIWPNRNTASDGTIGDSDEPDHASGNALDITNDPTNGPDLMALGNILLGDPRTHYVIFDSRIANRDVQAGAWRPYPERDPDETIGAYEDRARGYNAHSRHMHISFRRSGRADGSRWPRGAKDNAILARAIRLAPMPAPTSIDRLPDLLRQGIVDLWRKGLVDNFRWVPIRIGEYDIEVTSDAAAAYGLRMPASFDDVLELASIGDIIPPTKAIVDARWANAAKKIVLPPIPGGAHKADGIDPIGVQQVQQWDAALGPVSPGPLYDGGWKDWILEPNIPEGHAVNYGLRKDLGGSVWQPPGHAHDADWKDYSQLATFVKRKAKRNGVEVDLLDEIAKGGPLGGPLPQWIVDRLNGGSA